MKKLVFALLIFTASNAYAASDVVLVIKDHKFSPADFEVAAGEKVKIIVDNQDSTPEEFESYDLHREKIIQGNSKATIFIGPLAPGKYEYFGEFNPTTAKGTITAK